MIYPMASCIYLNIETKSLEVFFSRLNIPDFFSLPLGLSSRPWTIFAIILWTHSNLSIFFWKSGVQVWSHLCRIEGDKNFRYLRYKASPNAAQNYISHSRSSLLLLAHIQTVVNNHPQVFLWCDTLELWIPPYWMCPSFFFPKWNNLGFSLLKNHLFLSAQSSNLQSHSIFLGIDQTFQCCASHTFDK